MSLGLQRAGFDVLGVEQNADAVATHIANVGPCEQADIREWHPDPFTDVDLVAGGPPCTTFSSAGKREALEDPRGHLYEHLIRIALESHAPAVLMENVAGILMRRKGVRAIDVIAASFRRAGFLLHRATLKASMYGTPQHRYRVLIAGFRDPRAHAAFRWPVPTHGPPGNLLNLPPWITVRQALKLGGSEYHVEIRNSTMSMSCIDPDAPMRTVSGHTAEKLSPLDRPALVVRANSSHEGVSHRASQRPWSAVANARRAGDTLGPLLAALHERQATPLDEPAMTVTGGGVAGEHHTGGAEPFFNPAYRLALREVLSNAGLADRPSTTIDAGTSVSPAKRNGRKGHSQRANVVDPLRDSGLMDRPSTTVDTSNGIAPAGVHERNKPAVRLTVEQLAILQGFPPDFVVHGKTKASRHLQVGNALCPQLAEAVGGQFVPPCSLRRNPMPARHAAHTVPPYLLAARLRRRAERAGTPVHYRRIEAAVDRLRAQGDDPLAEREDEYRFDPDGPYVCPSCYSIADQPHSFGCDEVSQLMDQEDELGHSPMCDRRDDCDCQEDHDADIH